MASQKKNLEAQVRELTARNIELKSILDNTERECEERFRASEDFYRDAIQQASDMLQAFVVRHAAQNQQTCRIGGRAGRILLKLQKLYCMFRKMDSDAILLQQSPLFDPDYYCSTYPDVAAAQCDPIRHYLKHGWHEMRNPSPLFNTKEYLERYTDVKAIGINPLSHYLKWGYSENRQVPFAETKLSQIQPNDDDCVLDLFPSLDVLAAACRHAGGSVQNEELLKPELNTHPVLLVSHELTLTGAPIALLNLAEALVRLGKQPVFLAFSDGPLARNEEMQRFPLLILPPEKCGDWIKSASLLFDYIVINTTIGVGLIDELNGVAVPVLWWIHEAAASYNRQILEHWPRFLKKNIHVCCAGPLAEKTLHSFFPEIKAEHQCEILDKADYASVQKLWCTLEESGSGLQYCPCLVSVVIPTWQAGPDLPILLQKLRNQQNLKELEIVIVDSGSTDGTVEIARDAKVKLIQIPHEEFTHSGARNTGIEAAKGKYVLLMTQDAMPIGNLWLSRLLQPLLKNEAVAASCRQIPKAACTLFGRFLLNGFFRNINFMNDTITGMPYSGRYEDLRQATQLDNVSCVLDRDIFMQFKYRGNFAEDMDLAMRLLQAGYKLAHLGSTGVAHSHNRTPFYYFRRVMVDISTRKKITPGLPLEQLDERTVVSRIINTSLLLKEIRDLFSDKECWGYEELLQLLFNRHEELQDAVKRDIASGTDFPVFGRDEKLQIIISSIWQEYRGKYSYDETWPAEILLTHTKRLRKFIKSEIYRPDQSWGNELLDFWEQWLGGETGRIIAAFDFYHPNGNTLLNRIMKENQFDV